MSCDISASAAGTITVGGDVAHLEENMRAAAIKLSEDEMERLAAA